MKERKGILFLLSLLALSFFLLFPEAFAKEECLVCARYQKAGFPEDYAERLCALSGEYPEWEFEPLFITELSRKIGEEYDFETVMEKELEKKERNLVFGEAVFCDYWGNEKKKYDSGFYSASKEAVAYFLDPRNFLTEEGIFQFFPLSAGTTETIENVEKILRGSALEEVPLAGGKEMAELLMRLGEEWGVSPLHLAVRLRQEQGERGNALLHGTTGDYLALIGAEGRQDLNGWVNPFNISASGNSEEEIFASGALFAKKMGWDTLEKALAGGTEYLAKKYVLCYQNTLYLQKWNVDARSMENGKSRNFWGQYMQNIGAVKTEAEALFCAFSEADLLGEKLHFLIPVYENMPEEVSPDPAQGACEAFAVQEEKDARHPIPAETLDFLKEPSNARIDSDVQKDGRNNFSFLWCLPTVFLILAVTKPQGFAFRRKKRRFFW